MSDPRPGTRLRVVVASLGCGHSPATVTVRTANGEEIILLGGKERVGQECVIEWLESRDGGGYWRLA